MKEKHANNLQRLKSKLNRLQNQSSKDEEVISEINEKWKFDELDQKFDLVERFYGKSSKYNWSENSGRQQSDKALVLDSFDFEKAQQNFINVVPKNHEIKSPQSDAPLIDKSITMHSSSITDDVPAPPENLFLRLKKNIFSKENYIDIDSDEFKDTESIDPVSESIKLIQKLEEADTLHKKQKKGKVARGLSKMKEARNQKFGKKKGKFNISTLKSSPEL